MPRRRKKLFIAVPPNRTTKWTCTIKSIDVTNFVLSGTFPHGLISEELICELSVDNSGKDFTDKFAARDIIEFKMDFSDGSTTQFKGEIEEIKSTLEGGLFTLQIKGAHFSAQLLDVTVNSEFSGAKISDIRKDLISDFLTGFTSNNVVTNNTTLDIKFVNKALLDCLIELDMQGDEDTYIDFDKDFHTFKKGSIQNSVPHVTPEGLIQLRGLGTDSAEVRNKIIVYGESGGLQVIATSEDTASQTTFRTKEKVITDNTIINETQAQDLADAEQIEFKDPVEQGSALTYFHLTTAPGDKIYVITGEPHNIHDLFRVVKFVFRIPNETMEFYFNKERSVPKLFKERIRKSQSQETIINPFNMIRSFNFTFDDQSQIDTAASSSFTLEDGVLRKTSGAETGIMQSIKKASDKTANSMSLRVIGTELDGASYSFQSNSQANFQSISPNSTSLTTVTDTGKDIKLKITITSTTTRVDSAALYWK